MILVTNTLLLILLFQETNNNIVPQGFVEKFWPFVLILGIVLVAILYLFSTGTKQIHETQKETSKTLRDLLEIKDKQLKDSKEVSEAWNNKYCKSQEDLAALRAEYVALAGIDIKELLNFSDMTLELKLKQKEIDILNVELDRINLELIQTKAKK